MHVHQKGDARTKFVCRICSKSYLYRSSLRKHLQEHGYIDTGNVIDSSLYTEVKIEYDDPAYQNEQFMVKEEEMERYREPEISKYIFVDESQAIKALPNEYVDYKVEEDRQSSTDESQKVLVASQSTDSMPKINLDLFPSSPSDYLYKTFEPEPESKMLLPLTPLLGSPLRDRDCKDNCWDNTILNRPRNTTSSVIKYKGEIYFLYDRTLNRTKPNGELVMTQVDNDHVNPSNNCHRLPEISHYPDYQSLLKVYQEIVSKYSKCVTMEMLLSEKNCNSLTCKGNCKACESHEVHDYEGFIGGESPSPFNGESSSSLFFQQELSECPLEDSFCSQLRQEKANNRDGHVCLCEITRKYKHVHGPKCGHPAILHDGHIDYIVDGKLHHPEGDKCHDHGPIMVIDTSNEFAMSLISSGYPTDNKYAMDNSKFGMDAKFNLDIKYPMDNKFTMDSNKFAMDNNKFTMDNKFSMDNRFTMDNRYAMESRFSAMNWGF